MRVDWLGTVRLWWWRFLLWAGLKNRLTGPEDNAEVVRWFFNGPEHRRKGAEFNAAFRERANAPRP